MEQSPEHTTHAKINDSSEVFIRLRRIIDDYEIAEGNSLNAPNLPGLGSVYIQTTPWDQCWHLSVKPRKDSPLQRTFGSEKSECSFSETGQLIQGSQRDIDIALSLLEDLPSALKKRGRESLPELMSNSLPKLDPKNSFMLHAAIELIRENTLLDNVHALREKLNNFLGDEIGDEILRKLFEPLSRRFRGDFVTICYAGFSGDKIIKCESNLENQVVPENHMFVHLDYGEYSGPLAATVHTSYLLFEFRGSDVVLSRIENGPLSQS